MDYVKSDYITVLNKPQISIDAIENEAARIGECLYNIFKDKYKGEVFTVTIKQDTPMRGCNSGSLFTLPICNFLVMPKKDEEKVSAVDVNVCFNDAIYKFTMKWSEDGGD